MKARYRLTRRGSRGDTFYCKDTTTGQCVSLKTSDAEEAQRIVNAKNEAERQPMLNLQLAKAYLLGSDSAIAKRTWWDAILAPTETKFGTNKDRWITARKDKACQSLWPKRIVETQGDLANLHAEEVDWTGHTITYVRMKTKWRENQTPPQIKFGQSVADILNGLPKAGPLFP